MTPIDAVQTALLHAVVLAPLIAVAWWTTPGGRRSERRAWPLAAALGLVLVEGVLLTLPRLGPLADLEYNWQGKLLATTALLVLGLTWGRLPRSASGLVAPRPSRWGPVVVFAAALLALNAVGAASAPADRESFGEAFAFQATMPGIEEELFFRGVVWGLLLLALPGRRRVLGADLSWAFIVTTIHFGLVHGLLVRDGELVVEPAAIVQTAVLGAGLGWVRAATGSIWPGVVLHNLLNTTNVAAGWAAENG
ncbi:MAG: lysostaphin resistance A-like protein [Dermatophilaceae bacterium]